MSFTPLGNPSSISERGMTLIKSFEGYHVRQPDGSCKAYLDRLAKPHVWTIGYGLTEGVYDGMHLSAHDAEAHLKREISKHEAAVVRLCTVPLTQNQFDALTSFSYNVGSGALSRSTLLRKLNSGDYKGAAKQFHRWRMAGGKVYRGLERRRAAESALFLEPPLLATEVAHVPEDKPVVAEEVPEHEEIKEKLANSKKAKTAAVSQHTIGAGIAGWGVWESMKHTLGEANSGVTMVKSLLAEVGWVPVLGLALGAYAVIGYLRQRMREDVVEGRYDP